jgi:hypothetical protein
LLSELVSDDKNITTDQIQNAKVEVEDQKKIVLLLLKHINEDSDPAMFSSNYVDDLARMSGVKKSDLEALIRNYQKWKKMIIKNKGLFPTKGS